MPHKDHHHPHHPPHHQPHELPINRPFNTPENAMKSIATSKACLGFLKPGEVWCHYAPRGELEIKGALLLNEQPVVILHFNSVDGSLLPKGLHFFGEENQEVIRQVKSKLGDVIPSLAILEGAEFREPESCWVVPVVHKGRIVSHLKVSSDGGSVLVDRKAIDELRGYKTKHEV